MRLLKTMSVLRPAQAGVAPPVRRAWVQPKLRVGQPDDQYEREAELRTSAF